LISGDWWNALGDGIEQALVAALLENEVLTHLGLSFRDSDEGCWSELLGAVSTHPSLVSLDLESIDDEDGSMTC
jgi:hypothetical protein